MDVVYNLARNLHALIHCLTTTPLSCAGGESNSQQQQSASLNKKEFMEAKRRFDRVKHHPVEEPTPPQDDDMIEYKAADGKIMKMTRKEMNRRLEEQREFPKMGQDGKITKSEEGKASLDEVGTMVLNMGRVYKSSYTDQ